MITGNASATSPKDTFIQGLQSSSNVPAGQAGSLWTLPSSTTNTQSAPSTPNPTPVTTPAPDPLANYKSAMDTYIQSLAPNSDVTSAKSKYLDFENNLQSGIAGQEGQGRGIPLQIVRGEQAKLQTQGDLTANRLQGDITLAQDAQTATQNQNKARADYQLGLYNDQVSQAKPFDVGGSTYQYNPTTGKNEIVTDTADAQKTAQATSVAAQKFAVDNNITHPVYSTGGKFYDSGTQKEVDLPTFKKLTGQDNVPDSQVDYTKNVDTIGQTGSNKLLTPAEAKSLGVPYGTTQGQASKMGITPTTVKAPAKAKAPAKPTAAQTRASQQSEVADALKGVAGQDHYVSPQEWLLKKQAYVQAGYGTSKQFDSAFAIFKNPNDNYQ